MLICSCTFAWLVSSDLIRTSFSTLAGTDEEWFVCQRGFLGAAGDSAHWGWHPFFDAYSLGTQNKFSPPLVFWGSRSSSVARR